MAWPLEEELFFAASLIPPKIKHICMAHFLKKNDQTIYSCRVKGNDCKKVFTVAFGAHISWLYASEVTKILKIALQTFYNYQNKHICRAHM